MASANQTDILATFMSVTESSESSAKEYLEATNWDLETAMNTFYEAGRASVASHTNERSSSLQRNSHRNPINTRDHLPNRKPSSQRSIVSRGKPNENLIDLTDDSESEITDNHKQGHAPRGHEPTRQTGGKVAQVFDAARKQGAREEPDDKSSVKPIQPKLPFAGRGQSLEPNNRATRGEHPTPVHAPAPAPAPKRQEVPIRFYSNGFTVGDGELRSLEDNDEFLGYIKRGEVPPELKKQGQDIEIRLENHQSKEYIRKEIKFEAFSGTGHTIGLPSTSSSGSGRSPFIRSLPETLDLNRLQKSAERQLKGSASATVIRLRLPEISTPLVINIGSDRTLGDIRRFITEQITELRSNAFDFLEPPATKITAAEEKQKISETRFGHSNLAIKRTGK